MGWFDRILVYLGSDRWAVGICHMVRKSTTTEPAGQMNSGSWVEERIESGEWLNKYGDGTQPEFEATRVVVDCLV